MKKHATAAREDMSSAQKILAFVALTAASMSPVLAQDWTLTSAPPLDWRCIASSADGHRLTAGARVGAIYTSSNSGTTWVPNSALEVATSLACSADASILLAVANEGSSGGLCVSTNFGATWRLVFSPSNHWWTSVACSADGQRMAAVSGYGPWYAKGVYLSTNSGTDWILSGALVAYPSSIISSANGSRLAVADRGAVHVSTDWGATWTLTSPTNEMMWYRSVAASATGGTLIAAASQTDPLLAPGLVWISLDWGASWKLSAVLTNDLHWLSAASSADGVTLAVLESSYSHGTRALLSTNSGGLWSATTLDGSTNICSVVSSADGSKLAAALGQFWPGQGIYVRDTAPAPSLEILPQAGRLQVSWLLSSEHFVVQESSDFSGWSDVETAAAVLNYTNLHYEVNLTPPVVRRFYRLVAR